MNCRDEQRAHEDDVSGDEVSLEQLSNEIRSQFPGRRVTQKCGGGR